MSFEDIWAAAAAISGATGSISLYLLVGVVPCLLWLFFYLQQDKHPEPRREIISVFLIGALMAIAAMFAELALTADDLCFADFCFTGLFTRLDVAPLLAGFLGVFVGVALVEESAKYLAVWTREQAVNHGSQLDEPVDFVIYMIISAMGFAMLENLLFLLKSDGISDLLFISIFRALSAIPLHALCSGILGYYMAMTYCGRRKRHGFLATGLVIAASLHGLYNLSIIKSIENPYFLYATLAILLMMAFALFILFERLTRMKSTCAMVTKK